MCEDVPAAVSICTTNQHCVQLGKNKAAFVKAFISYRVLSRYPAPFSEWKNVLETPSNPMNDRILLHFTEMQVIKVIKACDPPQLY